MITVDNEIKIARTPPRRSNRVRNPVKIYEPSFTGKKYSFATIHPDAHMLENYGVDWDHVMHVTMTQLSMKAGMKRWGRPATKSVSKELQQLHFQDTFEPVNHKTLTKTEYDAVLESHLFLK